MPLIEACLARLREAYRPARVDVRAVRSPYRACPIGAHVDHQLGCVTGMPLDRGITLVFAPNSSRQVRLSSLDFPGEVCFPLENVPPKGEDDWGNYAMGAVFALLGSYPLRVGLDGVLAGDLPVGGLSSSAALGVACLMGLACVNGLTLSPDDLIALDQRIENIYLGLNNGILDQSVIVAGRKGMLLRVDCLANRRDLLRAPETMPPFEVLVVHSGMTRALVSTGYNLRVEECEEAARRLMEASGEPACEAPRLRLVPKTAYESFGQRLPAPLRRRAEHYFTENDRVVEGACAWSSGDLTRFGRLMTASGRSSIDNYECGSPPLIALYEILRDTGGVFGTRFSGAGFRGACIALVAPSHRGRVVEEVRRRYPERCPEYRGSFSVHACGTDDGARFIG